MPMNIPVSGVIPMSQITAESDDESDDEIARLRAMEAEARAFLTSFSWCRNIRGLYFGEGIGGVFAVFFAHIEPAADNIDQYLWVIVGDLPPAYLVTDESPTPREALDGYIFEMRRWVALAEQGKRSDKVIPVNAPPTPEWAAALRSRLDTLEQKIIPNLWP